MKNASAFVLLIFLLVVFSVMLVICTYTFIEAKKEVARYNQGVMESCLMISCDISPFGDLDCKTLESATNYTENDSYHFMILNFSGGAENG